MPLVAQAVARAYGDHLSGRGLTQEAGLAYSRGAESRRAMDAFASCLSWREALCAAERIPLAAAEMTTLACSLAGQSVVCVWSVCGQCVVGVWSVCGQCVVCVWSVCGQPVVSLWSVCGQRVVSVWPLCCQCRQCPCQAIVSGFKFLVGK